MDNNLKEKASQLLMFAFHGVKYNDDLKYLVEEIKVGGLIFFSRNISSLKQVKSLNKTLRDKSKTPLFLALDEEGGVVQRIKDIYLPGAMSISSAKCKKVSKITYNTGKCLTSLGFNVNFAPVCDVNNNMNNPVINSRSFSDDPIQVFNYANEEIKGFEKAGILPVAKHYPGHGDTSIDSHIGLPVVDKKMEELEKIELLPFNMLIENKLNAVMTSHVIYKSLDEKYPSSLSRKIINDYLKEKMNFQGLVFTDSLTMGAINKNYSLDEILINAVNAGVDVMVFCGEASHQNEKEIYETFLKLIDDGKISKDRIIESYEKIIRFKEKYYKKKMPLLTAKSHLSKKVADDSCCLYKDENDLLPLRKSDKILVIFPKDKIHSLVENKANEYYSLGKILNKKEIFVSENEVNSETFIASFKKEIEKYDKVIYCNINVKENDYQTILYKTLDSKKTIIVSLRSPYDIIHLEKIKKVYCYIAIFEATSVKLKSLSKCLVNKKKFKGIMPVKLGV